jgi:flagellar protein FlgJ
MRINPPAPLTSTAPVSDKKHADLKKATQQFEAYFLDELLKEMRKTVPKDTLLKDQSNQQEIFRDMMDQDMADNMSKRGDFGLGKMMYDQLSASLGEEAPKDPVKISR